MRRPAGRPCVRGRADFNPRTPVRGATNEFGIDLQLDVFQSTHPCAGCDPYVTEPVADTAISIHAPLCGVRRRSASRILLRQHFNPRTPVRGATNSYWVTSEDDYTFQSTHPCAGCDPQTSMTRACPAEFQSTHPCAGCDHLQRQSGEHTTQFQSTHPCAGCDFQASYFRRKDVYFNPRTPVRGATSVWRLRGSFRVISIHAPLCGVRPALEQMRVNQMYQFQSTHPCAGCDDKCIYFSVIVKVISIHAPLCGVRPERPSAAGAGRKISIHAPLCGVRPLTARENCPTAAFQSTHPCAGCDIIRHSGLDRFIYFNPRTPVRGATHLALHNQKNYHNFNPRTPVRGATVGQLQ